MMSQRFNYEEQSFGSNPRIPGIDFKTPTKPKIHFNDDSLKHVILQNLKKKITDAFRYLSSFL